MLIEFTIENYRSLRKKQSLSLVAKKNKEPIQHLLSSPALRRHQLLPAAAIYGANAAGKTNVIQAAAFMQQVILESASHMNDEKTLTADPYLLSPETRKRPSRLEMIFIHRGMRFQYGFALDAHKVHEEYLYAYPKGNMQVWFERHLEEGPGVLEDFSYDWYFGPHLKGEKSRLKKMTRPGALFLSLAALLNHEQLRIPFEWFKEKLCIVPSKLRRQIPAHYFTMMATLKDNPNIHEEILRLLQYADLGISNFHVEEKSLTEEDLPSDIPEEFRNNLIGFPYPEITMMHPSDEGEEYPMAFHEESAGTQRLFALAGPMLHVLEEGRVLFIDELESSLHPLLSARILRMFNSEVNKKEAQLIFSTHNTNLLNREHLRRDQIWFVEKNGPRTGTELIPLLDYHPRKEEAWEKAYLGGRYGGVPILEEM